MINNQESINALKTRIEASVRDNDYPSLELLASECQELTPNSLNRFLPGILSIALERKYNKIATILITKFGTPLDRPIVQDLFLLDYLVKADNFALLSDLHANKANLDFSIYFFNMTNFVHQNNERFSLQTFKMARLETVVRFAQFYAWVAKQGGHQILADLKKQLDKEKMKDISRCILLLSICSSSLNNCLTTDHVLYKFKKVYENPRWYELQTKAQITLDLWFNIKLYAATSCEGSKYHYPCYRIASEKREQDYELILSTLKSPEDSEWMRGYAVNANAFFGPWLYFTGLGLLFGYGLVKDIYDGYDNNIGSDIFMAFLISFLLAPLIVPTSLVAARVLSFGSLKIVGDIAESTASAVVNLELNRHAKYVGAMYQNHKNNAVSLNTVIQENQRDDQIDSNAGYVRLTA